MPLLIVLLMSCMLALTGCAKNPPCNRADITAAYAPDGKKLDRAVTVSGPCWDRILGDLDACYPRK